MKWINYIWGFFWLAVINNLVKKSTFFFDKLSQNRINESKLVYMLRWLYLLQNDNLKWYEII